MRVRIKRGWDQAGRTGTLRAVVESEQMWAVVVWDGEDDPDCFKLSGLIVAKDIPANFKWGGATDDHQL